MAQATDSAIGRPTCVRPSVSRTREGLFDDRAAALLEVGPGQTLSQLARQCPAKTARHEIIHSLTEDTTISNP